MIKTKQQSLLRSTSLVSIMTLMSRLMGFARDMVLAYFFGTQPGMDAFFVAFRIPNFMRRLFAEGAFSQAFVPVLAEYQKTRTVDEVRQFLARIAGSMGIVLTLVTIIGIIAIFYPHGLPRILTHSYLICTSVLLAWELSGV